MYKFLMALGAALSLVTVCPAQAPKLEMAEVSKIGKRIVEARQPYKNQFDLENPEYNPKDHLWYFKCISNSFPDAPTYVLEVRDSDRYFRMWVSGTVVIRSQRALEREQTFRPSPK